MIHSTHRFHGRSGLRFAYQHGVMVRGETMGLRVVRNPREHTWRTAVVVSRKVSKSAVVRNRIRRRIFETVRREAGRLRQPVDLVFNVFSAELATVSHEELAGIIGSLLDKAGLSAGPSGREHGIVEPKEKNA